MLIPLGTNVDHLCCVVREAGSSLIECAHGVEVLLSVHCCGGGGGGDRGRMMRETLADRWAANLAIAAGLFASSPVGPR